MSLSPSIKAEIIDSKPEVAACQPPIRAVVYFGSVCSSDFGVYLGGIQISDSPKRDVTYRSVPGRNGDLAIDNGRWYNLDITYNLLIPRGFSARFDAFKAALLSQTGYQRLRDTIYPDVYRMAITQQPIAPESMRYNQTGRFDITFCCKPQRYLVSGENPVVYTAPGAIYNPTSFAALPIITVYGTGPGAVTVGDATVEIKALEDQIILDCDLQNAYRQPGEGAPENKNGSIYAPEFPRLQPGENPVSWTGNITKIEIIPRWWTL